MAWDDALIRDAIHAIERLVEDAGGCRPQVLLRWMVGPVSTQAFGSGLGQEAEMSLVLTDTQQCDLSIQPVDAHGHPARIDGTPTWSSSDDAICPVTPDASDPLKAIV